MGVPAPLAGVGYPENIACFFFSLASELNPVEHVWEEIRESIYK